MNVSGHDHLPLFKGLDKRLNLASIPELYIQREYFFYGKIKFKYLYAPSIAVY